MTVNNFVVLAVNGYYNGLTFWDAPDWEVQAGDPKGNGTGGPGYNLPEEPTPELTWDGRRGRHGPGARRADQREPVLHRQVVLAERRTERRVYNRFGTVIAGLDKVSAISAGDRINTVTITVSNPTASAPR